MKYLIASDIHGSLPAAQAILARAEEAQVDKILLLGDILYHGARNDLSQGYDTKAVFALLNQHAADIVAVRGNCDAEIDQMVLDFPLTSASLALEDPDAGITLFLTHGHRPGMNPRKPDELIELPERCIFCSGHTHVKVLQWAGEWCASVFASEPRVSAFGDVDTTTSVGVRSDVLFLNPGSAGLPKDGEASYALYNRGEVVLSSLDGTPLARASFV